MNEMDLLRAHHDAQPPPSPETVAGARDRLLTRARSRRSRVRPSRLAIGGMGLAATAAAVAAVLAATASGTPRPHRTVGPEISGGQLLLAAHQAESASTAGTYWHLRTEHTISGTAVGRKVRRISTEIWARRDGRAWIGSRVVTGDGAGTAGLHATRGPHTFVVCDKEMTYRRLATLPSSPPALRAALVTAVRDNDDAPVPPAAREGFLAGCLSGLLAEVPAPPKVRAAAYRLLATMPQARVEGRASDPRGRVGVAVRVDDGSVTTRLIIDPRTSFVLAEQQTPDRRAGGTAVAPKSRTSVYLGVGWTDERPHVPIP